MHPLIWARRSPLRYLVLSILYREPRTGMDIMREIERITLGFWRPSPGTIYPLLKLLEKEGLVKHETRDGRKVYFLTEKGKEIAREFSFMLPAKDVDDVVERLESYVSYLQDYSREYGLSEDLKRKLLKISKELEELAGGSK